MADQNHELEALLSLDGQEFDFGRGYRVRIDVRRVEISPGRRTASVTALPCTIGLDNAHGVLRRHPEFDHRHVYGGNRLVPYSFRGQVRRLEDFYREVERILRERGA